jgi:phenylacetaldehyde dehydrogenase
MTTSERGRIIWKIGDLILEHADELAQLESLDNGKPFAIAKAADIPLAADLFHYMAGWATKLEGNTINISVPYMPAPTSTRTRCGSRSEWSVRSSRGTSRC